MAHAFSLTDGTTTIALNSGAYLATEWSFGAESGRNNDEVTGTLKLLISGATIAAIATSVRAVETLLDKARRRTLLHVGPRVYFRVQWDGEAEAWQAEVVDGRLEDVSIADQLRRGKIEVDLSITRRYFETVNWTQLTLTNTNGTNNTSGLAVYVVNDGSGAPPTDRVNYLDIDAAEVTGSLPAPIKLELANATGGTVAWSNWFLSVNALNDPANFAHMIEAESAAAGGSSVSCASCSGGNARQYTASGTYEIHYTLSAATVQDCAGSPFRVLIGFASGDDPPTGYVTAQIRTAGGSTTLASGDRVQLAGSATEKPVDCGVLTIPPGDYSITYGELRLVIQFYTATSQTVKLDWISLLPSQSTRFLKSVVVSLASGEKVVLDESEKRSFVTDGTYEYPFMTMQGQPLLLQPGATNRLYILVARATGTTVTDKFLARAWVKQRRLTV